MAKSRQTNDGKVCVSTYIPRDLHVALKKKCNVNGQKISSVVAMLVQRWVTGEVKLTE